MARRSAERHAGCHSRISQREGRPYCLRCRVFLDGKEEVVVKRGLVRMHKRWLDADRKPALVRVTAVRNGMVFYGFGADATRGNYYITVEGFLTLTEAPK